MLFEGHKRAKKTYFFGGFGEDGEGGECKKTRLSEH